MDRPLVIWVPGKLKNPLNMRWHWAAKYRWSADWRERTGVMCRLERNKNGREWFDIKPDVPKVIEFNARMYRLMDDDGLVAAIKPIRDALQDKGVEIIHKDGPKSLHRFVYRQTVDRDLLGVEIVVTLRDRAEFLSPKAGG